LPKEVPDTLRLYLDGEIAQFWFRADKPSGAVFLMNSTSVEEAKSIIEALPLAAKATAYPGIPLRGYRQRRSTTRPGQMSRPVSGFQRLYTN
jgi:hypothetical protein